MNVNRFFIFTSHFWKHLQKQSMPKGFYTIAYQTVETDVRLYHSDLY